MITAHKFYSHVLERHIPVNIHVFCSFIERVCSMLCMQPSAKKGQSSSHHSATYLVEGKPWQYWCGRRKTSKKNSLLVSTPTIGRINSYSVFPASFRWVFFIDNLNSELMWQSFQANSNSNMGHSSILSKLEGSLFAVYLLQECKLQLRFHFLNGY